MHQGKNYKKDGGNTLVIGGKLIIEEGAQVEGLPKASETAEGGVKMAAKVNEAAGENPTAAEFKALLDALKAAGIMKA